VPKKPTGYKVGEEQVSSFMQKEGKGSEFYLLLMIFSISATVQPRLFFRLKEQG
jgi:hypothetical protein